jgi:uncharacterized phage protein (TIGR01671 family)
MKETKFRAWDKGNKVIHNDFEFISSGNEGNDWIVFIPDKSTLSDKETNPFENPNPYFSQQLKKMQYTGLEDKSKEPIYEGDIVNCNGFISEIKWSKSTGYKIVDRYTCRIMQTKGYSLLGSRNHICEVIGNIHENLELLDDTRN